MEEERSSAGFGLERERSDAGFGLEQERRGGGFEMEEERSGAVQYFDFMTKDFNFTRIHIRVNSTFRTSTNQAFNLNHELTTAAVR